MYACNQNPTSSSSPLDYDSSSKSFDRCQPTRLDQAPFKVQQGLEIEALVHEPLPLTAAAYDAIFEAVSKVLEENSSSSMDPTPIGLLGVFVVDRVPLVKSAWIYDHTMLECLSSFVPNNKRKSIGVSSMVDWNYNSISSKRHQKIEMDDDDLSLVDWEEDED